MYHVRHKRPTDFHTETQERRCSGQHSRHRGIDLLCEGRPGASPRPRIASRTAHIQRSTQSNVSYITPRWYGIQNLAQGASISLKLKADETNVSQNPSIESLSAKPPIMQQGSRLAKGHYYTSETSGPASCSSPCKRLPLAAFSAQTHPAKAPPPARPSTPSTPPHAITCQQHMCKPRC